MNSLDKTVGFLIFLVVAGYLLVVLYRYFTRPTWKDMPTLQAYLQKFPSCKTNHGIRCRHCRSNSIRNWGWKSADDARRLFICNHCGQILYRNDLEA